MPKSTRSKAEERKRKESLLPIDSIDIKVELVLAGDPLHNEAPLGEHQVVEPVLVELAELGHDLIGHLLQHEGLASSVTDSQRVRAENLELNGRVGRLLSVEVIQENRLECRDVDVDVHFRIFGF